MRQFDYALKWGWREITGMSDGPPRTADAVARAGRCSRGVLVDGAGVGPGGSSSGNSMSHRPENVGCAAAWKLHTPRITRTAEASTRTRCRSR